MSGPVRDATVVLGESTATLLTSVTHEGVRYDMQSVLQTNPSSMLRKWAELDPALLAFLKCHVTSPLKWETLRLLELQEGNWIDAEHAAQLLRRPHPEVERALAELGGETIVDEGEMTETGSRRYRLSPNEPSTVVPRRLLQTAANNHELRQLIAAHLLRSQRPTAVAWAPA